MIDISGLAYVVAESTELGRWTAYAQGVLGMMTETSSDGGLYIKMDERQFRIAVRPGARDAYVASGWEVRDQTRFERAVATLQKADVALEHGDSALCQLRRVQQMVSFSDPSGNRHELVWGFKSDFAHFASPAGVSRFVTGDIGMGHTVLPAPNFDVTARFLVSQLFATS